MPAAPRVSGALLRLSAFFLGLAGFLSLVALGPTPALGQQSRPKPPGPRLEDRNLGEQEQIQRRLEWFYSTRRDGVPAGTPLALLRQAAVEETARRIRSLQMRRGAGLAEPENFWASLGPAPSTFGGWAFGNVSGRVAALAADWPSGTFYVGSASGGLWKSTNLGASWSPLFDSAGTLTIGTVTVDPNDPQTLWIGTGENVSGCESYFGIGLLRSTDGGATWEARNGGGSSTLEDLSSFADVVVDPRNSNHLVTGGRLRGCTTGNGQSGGLYTSDDGGMTWTPRLSGTQIYEIVQDPAVQDIFWAASNKGIYKSTDNGANWTLQTASGLPNGDTGRTELAVSPSDSSVVYALFASGASGNAEFWRSGDGGASWTKMSEGGDACDGQCWYNMVVRVHRTDPDIVYRGTVHVFKSLDGGATWTDLSNSWGSSQKVHQDTHELLMNPDDPESFWVGCDGGVWQSQDGGSSFVNRIGNLTMTQFYAIGVHPTDGGIICGGAQDNSSLARTTSDVWDLQAVTGDGFVCHIDPQNPDYNYITSYPSGGYPHVSRSENGILGSFHGITGAGSGIYEGDRINWVTPYILDPTSPNILFLGTHRVYRSTNYGDHWDPVGPEDLTNGSGNVLSLDINRNFPNVVLAGTTDGKVWRSTNGGIDWTDISTGLPSRAINDLASDPTNPGRLLAVVGGFNSAHLWVWGEDSGWSEGGSGLPNVPTNTVMMLTDSRVYVGADTGVFKSIDGGASFEPFMNGLPQGLVVTDLKYNQSLDLLSAGTYGRGAWQIVLDPVGPIVLYDSIEQPLVEVDGDGDGSVEPGETWQVRPLLRNVGSEIAQGVTARLATTTAGVRILDPEVRGYGDIAAGATAPVQQAYSFVVDPTFPCGEAIVFDLLEIHSTNPPGSYSDAPGAFTVTVLDDYEPPIYTTLLDEDFDPPPASGWTHEAVDPNIFFCHLTYVDEWKIVSKDAEHGDSYHCGNGPGSSYSKVNDAWLYQGGRDSTNGPGIDLPGDARTITLTLVHWYSTEDGADGGEVAIDDYEDDNDVYNVIEPDGGYPGGNLATGRCNGLEDKPAFQGDSGGWITSTFDLTPYRGKKIYLAFLFGSDSADSGDEGWYIDQVKVESEKAGAPICQITQWPGSVPETASFVRVAGDQIEATWEDSCNSQDYPGQLYSIQEGDLDALFASGGFDHSPLAGLCSRTSPDTFTPGAGNHYYLVVPNADGREGGFGTDSSGATRPQVSTLCGEWREGACP